MGTGGACAKWGVDGRSEVVEGVGIGMKTGAGGGAVITVGSNAAAVLAATSQGLDGFCGGAGGTGAGAGTDACVRTGTSCSAAERSLSLRARADRVARLARLERTAG